MNDKLKTLQINKYNTDYPVTLTYDKCRSGESEYGKWNLYGVEYHKDRQAIFADEDLHDKLKQYSKGTKLVIRRNQNEQGKPEWQVIPQNDKGIAVGDQTVLSRLDDRTRDIHRQVALKIATISIGQNIKPWTDEDLHEIKLRMDKLLEILEGDHYELPY